MTAQATMGRALAGSAPIPEALISTEVNGVTDESLNSLSSVNTGCARRDAIVGGYAPSMFKPFPKSSDVIGGTLAKSHLLHNIGCPTSHL